MNILEQIISERRADVLRRSVRVSLETLREMAAGRKRRSLIASLQRADVTCVIAEMKKASPSAGLLTEKYIPSEIARNYEKAGASAISVLTEPKHFMGSDDHLRRVRDAVNLPILRKDFICDVYQVYETAAFGADVMLLIVAALDRSELVDLYHEAVECGLEVLVEAHTVSEVETAVSLDGAIVGVNSRDLKTLRTDLSVARSLIKEIPSGRIAVAESGIKTREDIVELKTLGYRGFLVGEALMREGNPHGVLERLVSG